MATFRISLFFGVCVVARSLLALLAAWLGRLRSTKYLRIMGIVFLIPMFGFFIKHMSHNPSEIGAFGGDVWWNRMRLVHALLYRAFGVMAIAAIPQAYLLLILDVIIGTVATMHHYFT